MVKNFIDAKEARKLTKETQKPLNVLFKRIREVAEWGCGSLTHGVYEFDFTIKENMISALEEAGYKVDYNTTDDGTVAELVISW